MDLFRRLKLNNYIQMDFMATIYTTTTIIISTDLTLQLMLIRENLKLLTTQLSEILLRQTLIILVQILLITIKYSKLRLDKMNKLKEVRGNKAFNRMDTIALQRKKSKNMKQ